MATDHSRSRLTAQQVLLQRVMREVVARVQDAGFVLKGGGALAFAYGSRRHTRDLDFDAERKTDMTRRIRRAIQAAGVEIDEGTWWWPRGTRATRVSMRYRVQFVDPQGERGILRVDTRYRPKPDTRNITVVEGIRTYKPETLYSQKLAALNERSRAKDVFDLAFLASRHGDILTDAQIRKAEAITRDMDGLEESLVCQIKIDPVLSKITTAEDLVIEFRQAVDAQFHRRKMKFPQQSVPISIPMTREIIDLRRLLHGDETVKPRKNQSPRRVIRSETNRPDRERAIQQPDWFDR